MLQKSFFVPFCAALLLYACSCADGKKAPVIRDLSVTVPTSFNTIFFDSAYLDTFLLKHPEFVAYSKQYKDFYTGRNFQYAWFDSVGFSEQAHNFYNLQNDYIASMGDSSIYNDLLHRLYDSLGTYQQIPDTENANVLLEELLMTGQFFKYASKQYKGAEINPAELGWYIPRKKVSLSALLDTLVNKKPEDPQQYTLINRQYIALEKALLHYVQLEKKELPDMIAKLKKSLKEGDSAAVVPAIKKRLNLLQDAVFMGYNNVVDEALVNAAKKYQRTNGLSDDGVIGNKMIADLNVPVKKRIEQILVNMERARWMPVERGKDFVLVNIPEFKLHVFENGKQQLEMKVIVGSAAHNTVIFTAQLKYIVFSPYWNVPASITRNEIVPAIRRNSNYISKNNMEVTGYVNGLPEIRQKPGPHNALGLVKFLFPNSFNIYLHDTPGKHLFEQTGRGFSHGCIRIAEPKKFAEYLLRDDRQTYTSEAIDSLMNLGREKWVPLKKQLPVFLVYFTAWVDADGVLNFRNDFYGHDKKMAAKLFNN